MWTIVNQKQKASMNNAEENRGELMPLSKKNSNLCKHNVIHFQYLANFWIVLSVVVLPAILVDGHWFQLLSSLNAYIDTFKHGKKQFASEQQGLKFYANYAGVAT